jgi:ApaG protein
MKSEATTRDIHVEVDTELDLERSEPEQHRWFYLYTVTISNQGDETVQLIGRHWVITDAEGRIEEVRGPGVVGHQPVLAPGKAFRYTSGCPLSTPYGSMHGVYEMVTADGEAFDAEIAPFELFEPYMVN